MKTEHCAINRSSVKWMALMVLVIGILPRTGVAADEPEFVVRSAG